MATTIAQRNRADKLDNQYGGYRYVVKPVFEEK